MIIIPAIDLKDHQVVRLSQGKMDNTTVYSSDPVDMASRWIDTGITRLHLVDLNGAFEGKPIHFREVQAIAKKFPHVQIEIGGGIRKMETVSQYFDAGVTFCILGTAAIKNPEFLRAACTQFPNRIVLGIDAKNGQVATEGWDDVSSTPATALALKFKDVAIESIIYTDIAKDGMLQGMNMESIRTMAEQCPFPIIGSGGFTRLQDITDLKGIPNVMGVIAGKALYEGKVDLKEALRAAL